MDLVHVFYQPWMKRVARGVLFGRLRAPGAPTRGRFTRADIDGFLSAAWGRYDTNARALKRQPTLGSAMNVRLACFTHSFFEVLLAGGVERGYAIELVADAAWRVYAVWARVATKVGRLTPGKTSALGFATSGKSDGSVSLRFPFNAPGYTIKKVAVERGTAFDVVHCPVASYFREHDATDLCVAAWCNLDYALAEMTHQKLVRTLTIVQGSDHCDFRILPEGPQQRS